MALTRDPLIYEINTWVWLAELSAHFHQPITLANVPTETLDELATWGFNVIWMMGVWERSPQGRDVAWNYSGLQTDYERALPDFTAADVVGSPYAVYRYQVADSLGGHAGLATFRQQLADRGLKLFLDYVPNHVAVDHHWTLECPPCLVNGTASDLESRPGTYYTVPTNGLIIAHGRDPYFPAWTDTAQVDAFSDAAREQARDTLLDIARQCDGVRCDMAMLMVNYVFAQTWHRTDIPTTEFWQVLIPSVKAYAPDFAFMAEVYWDMEAELQSLGFDYTYDKRLYDRMRDHGADGVRDHLLAPLSYQQKMVRFIENHDEARALRTFGLERSQAAAVLITLLPGARLIYEGQMDGRRVKVPVQLGRRPTETPIEPLSAFYRKLLKEATQAPYHSGGYMALAANPILGNDHGDEALVTFAWAQDADWRIVIVNYSAQPVQARVMIPRPDLHTAEVWTLTDALTGDETLHLSNDILTAGVPINLTAYGAQVFMMRPADAME